MIKFIVIAEVHTVPDNEIENHETINHDYPGLGMETEWPVLPRIGEQFQLPGTDRDIVYVWNVAHLRCKNDVPEIRVYMAVTESEHSLLKRDGYTEGWT